MRGRDIAVLGIRLLAIYAVIFTVAHLPWAVATATPTSRMQEGVGVAKTSLLWVVAHMFGSLVITVIMAIVLWQFAPTISGLVIPGSIGRSRLVPPTARNVRSAALSAVGVLLCIYAVLPIIRIIFVDLAPLRSMSIYDLRQTSSWARAVPAVLQYTAQLAIGIWLFLRPRAAARASSR